MNEPHCFVCGMVAGYEDVSDGDFDTENNICYPCSIEDKDWHWATPRNYKPNYSECYTDEPPSWSLISQKNLKEYSISLEEMSDRTWDLCIRDGLPPIYRCSEWSIRAGGWTMEEYIERDAKNKHLYILREIDLLGPKNIKQNLGRWISPLNKNSTTTHPIKPAHTYTSNFGGGGGIF